MEVSTKVAYRIYKLPTATKAIAFNTATEHYMFLDGLSAELLELVIRDNEAQIQQWMVDNEVSLEDINTFNSQIKGFGFWDTEDGNQENIANAVDVSNADTTEHEHSLNLFQNFLHSNGLFYLFHIDLTNRCNEKCIHCYHPFEQYDHSNEMTFVEVKTLIDTIYDLGVFCVTLSGGECLLRKDFWDILSYISSKGMMTTVFTNGLLLTEENVRKLTKYRVKLVSISLYGDTAEVHDRITTIPGSYQKTLAGIERLKAHKIPFELKCVVLAENIARIEQIRTQANELTNGRDCKTDFSLCGKLDGNCGNFSHRASMEEIKKVFFSNPERYFSPSKFQPKQPNETPCGAGKYGLYCSAEGNIYPCVSFRLLLCSHRELSNIATNSILTQWRNTKISDFTDCFRHSYCKYCTEQCAGNNLIENGNHLDSRNISNCERAMIISEWFEAHSDHN